MCTKKFSELTIPDGHNLKSLKRGAHVSFFRLKKQQSFIMCQRTKNKALTSNLFMIKISNWKASCK